ncbi:MAG: hypothetical protein ACTMUB_05760 [cyanobacterium endosymbiont of Rhopalodia musculus]|uniref:hypothetical protein n=1 Tax=cyanobacterium endosymbiont of Epithemia clementina EcSB TaxID=3034674 RepID=UPI002480E374|nr:hypothetical protein [cyanobacterium endosymbiont of Epithemia clementina EcSB]WGT67645.1 hypothetical protein P3F56_00620 [cyanobacterium endosymbiont of Epithemia clementina EcSB]
MTEGKWNRIKTDKVAGMMFKYKYDLAKAVKQSVAQRSYSKKLSQSILNRTLVA